MSKHKYADRVRIVFDGPPEHEAGRFVEVERGGKSISYGEWERRKDGMWELVLPAHASPDLRPEWDLDASAGTFAGAAFTAICAAVIGAGLASTVGAVDGLVPVAGALSALASGWGVFLWRRAGYAR